MPSVRNMIFLIYQFQSHNWMVTDSDQLSFLVIFLSVELNVQSTWFSVSVSTLTITSSQHTYMCILQQNVWNYCALNMFLGSYMSSMNTTGTEKHKMWHEQLTTTAQAWGRKEQKAGNKNRRNAWTVTLWSARALITLPSANSERLMLAPSRKRAPRFLVTFARSDPARSTRHILATFTSAEILAVRSLCLTNTCNNNTTVHICI